MDKANFEIVGNVGKIEIKTFGKTGKLATLSVATSERWKTEDGTQKDRTYWHRVTVFAPPSSPASRRWSRRAPGFASSVASAPAPTTTIKAAPATSSSLS
jgi:single-stranded DNA-binding protein